GLSHYHSLVMRTALNRRSRNRRKRGPGSDDVLVDLKPTLVRKLKIVWPRDARSLDCFYLVRQTVPRIGAIDEVSLRRLHGGQAELLFDFLLVLVGETQHLNDPALPDNALAGRFIPKKRVTGFEFVVRP